jgi:hypothetical protein
VDEEDEELPVWPGPQVLLACPGVLELCVCHCHPDLVDEEVAVAVAVFVLGSQSDHGC